MKFSQGIYFYIALLGLFFSSCSTKAPVKHVQFYGYEKNPNLPAEHVFNEVKKWLGVSYKYGGNSSQNVDCSAFVRNVFWQLGWVLPRTTSEQIKLGFDVSISELKIGDLVFFDTNRNGEVSHVGIYLGDKNFAHSSQSNGVTISRLTQNYYKKTFLCARRIVWNF